MQKFVKRVFAVVVTMLTVCQTTLPTFAQENDNLMDPDLKTVEISNLDVEVKGAGTVKVSDGNNDYQADANTKLSLKTNVGTNIHFSIDEEDPLYLHDFQLNGNTLEGFQEDVLSFEYDYTTTDENATFVISFETKSKTENTGVATEKQAAKDADIGKEEKSKKDENSKEVKDYNNDGVIDVDDYYTWLDKQDTAENSISLFSSKAARAGGSTFNDITGAGIDGNALVSKARSWVGRLRYGYGAKHPSSGSIDCSGFVTWMFREYLGTMWQGSTQGGWDYNPTNYVGDRNTYYDANSGPGMYTMGAWDAYTGHLYLDPYGIGSPNLMDVRAWDTLLRNGKAGTKLSRPVESSSVTLCGNTPAEGFSSFNPGDIVIFYLDNGGTDTSSGVPHMGIYSGNGNFIHSSVNTNGVAESPLTSIHTGSEGTPVRSYRIWRVSESKGAAKMTKKSAIPSITDGNDCYKLGGAEYGLYSDAGATKKVGTFTIDASGNSNTITDLQAGTYYIKETKAPQGYAMDTQIHSISVVAGQTATFNATDYPQSDPIPILLGKIDAETNANKPQGSASLADAQFTIKYYDGFYSTEAELTGKTPERTWVVKTDSDGYSELSDAYKISGDELYKASNGDPTLPLGTVTIQETQAPDGYHINDELFIRQITSEGTAEMVTTYNMPTVPETPTALKLFKKQVNTDVEIAGAEFKHTRPDGSTETVVTDSKGELRLVGLVPGRHSIQETKAPDGYDVNGTKIDFEIDQNGNMTVITPLLGTGVTSEKDEDGNLYIVMEDKVSDFDFKLTKTNEDDKILDGAEFTLYEDEDCTKEIETLVTKNGTLQFEDLKDRTHYYLKETKAPQGYRIPHDENDEVHVYEIYVESIPARNQFNFYIDGKMYTVSNTNVDDSIHLEGTKADRVIAMTVINYKGFKLPNTGSSSMYAILLIGTLGMIYGLIKFHEKKKSVVEE